MTLNAYNAKELRSWMDPREVQGCKKVEKQSHGAQTKQSGSHR